MKDKHGNEHSERNGQFVSKGATSAEAKRFEEITGSEFTEADEFRYIKNHENKKVQGHPAHIYAKSGEQAKYLQMTHSKFINDMAEANVALNVNPKPGDERTAYIVPKSQISNLENLGKVMKGWKLSEIDNETIVIYRDEPFNKKR